MTPDFIIAKLEEHCRAWIAAKRGKTFFAGDAFEPLEILAGGPVGFTVIFQWEGDGPLVDNPDADVVADTFKIIVSQNRGMSILRGETLVKGRAGQEPLWKICRELRDLVRSIVWDDGVNRLKMSYRGGKPVVAPQGVALDAQELKFTLPTQ